MKINFILLPCNLSGGPLAILEYANRFAEKGHEVTVTTAPSMFWPSAWNKKERPFPWFDFKGEFIYKKSSKVDKIKYRLLRKNFLESGGGKERKIQAGWLQALNEAIMISNLVGYMPECDLNIATYWSTVYAAYFSKKGKPVYFMQHYEEVFFTNEFCNLLLKLGARLSYQLPVYKVANSSWLQQQMIKKFNQNIPFSNNAVDLKDFKPQSKWSEDDNIIRIMTFSRPEEWKGFADVAVAMKKILKEYDGKVEWHVFGREHNFIKHDNIETPYVLHTGLSYVQLAELYAKCDITICGSWYESFPLPPIESMAAGTAVVTTTYGMEDYCYDGVNSLMVSSRDTEAMYLAIKQLIDNKELRDKLAEEGLKTAQNYGWEIAVTNREKILKDIYESKVDYNIYEPLNLGFSDVNQIPFEEMPLELKEKYKEGVLISHMGIVYRIEHGCKRHISSAELFTQIVMPGTPVIEVDAVDFARIPLGFPILNIYD